MFGPLLSPFAGPAVLTLATVLVGVSVTAAAVDHIKKTMAMAST